MATFKQGEIVQNIKTGARFKVGEEGDLDPSQYARIQGDVPTQAVSAAPKTAAMDPQMAANLPPAPEEDLMAKGRQQAVQDANQTSKTLTSNVVAPLAQAGLAYGTGGLSLPLQAAIGAGTEYGLQKAGINPESNTQIGLQAAVPFAGPLVSKVANKLEGVPAGIGRFIANITGKGQQAGEQAIAERLSVPLEGIERSTHAPSKSMYQAAERQGPLDTSKAAQGIDDAIAKEKTLGSQANKKLIKQLEGIKTDLASGTEDAEVLVAKSQRLMKDAEGVQRRQPALAKSMREAADTIKTEVPGQKAADVAYTRESAIDDIFTAVRKSDKLGAVDKLIQDQGSKLRSVIPDKDLKAIRTIAGQIEGMTGPNAGVFKTIYDAGLKSFLSDPNGLTVFRKAFGPNLERITPQGMAGLMTFIRGYNAYNQKEDQPRGNVVEDVARAPWEKRQ